MNILLHCTYIKIKIRTFKENESWKNIFIYHDNSSSTNSTDPNITMITRIIPDSFLPELY